MNENPYSAPGARLEKTADDAGGARFYVVSPGKMTVLFFVTLGLYTVYWFYRHFREYRDSSGSDMWPVPRAIFNIFFAHTLFRLIRERLDAAGRPYDWSPSTTATAYVVFAVGANVVDRLAFKYVGSPYTDLAGLLLLVAMYACLLSAQKAANAAVGDPAGSANSRFTLANWVWIVLGVLFWGAVLVGLADAFGLLGAAS